MSRVLIVGATRGLGASLVKKYASNSRNTVHATTRSDWAPKDFPELENVKWACRVDLMKPEVGKILTSQLGSEALDVVIISAGHVTTEDFTSGPNWDEEVRMYTTSSIAPVSIVHALASSHLRPGTKILLVSSEAGSITLRHPSEGGGNYAHHASKAALNMAGRLLALDLKEAGVVVGLAHPGFMRTDMTKNVGFDKYWDEGGAVTPEQAAERLVDWVEKLTMERTGELWAPGGEADIGTAEAVMGKNLRAPLKLPW